MGGKVTVVGAGFYGSTTALRLAEYDVFDTVVLTDILEGKPEAKKSPKPVKRAQQSRTSRVDRR